MQQKTAKEEERLPDLPVCQLSANVRKKPVALGFSALHLRSFELFVAADFHVSVSENHGRHQRRHSGVAQDGDAQCSRRQVKSLLKDS